MEECLCRMSGASVQRVIPVDMAPSENGVSPSWKDTLELVTV